MGHSAKFNNRIFTPVKIDRQCVPIINSLPNNKFLDVTKLKAFADDKLNIVKMTIFLFYGVENTVGKGENAGCQHFLPFQQCFPKPSLRLLKVRIMW